jgi:ubiquitin carboxyl-terminal hydrolase 7
LVHSGDISGGHYYVFIKREDRWFKFDDDKVFKVDSYTAINENYGGFLINNKHFIKTSNQINIENNTSAYMLVYIRKTEINNILNKINEDEIPNHLYEIFEKERIEYEKFKLEKEMEKKFIKILVFSHSNINKINMVDLFQTTQNTTNFKINKEETIKDLYDKIFLSFDNKKANYKNSRIWTIFKRSNNTYRVSELINSSNLDKSKLFIKIEIEKIFDNSILINNNLLLLYFDIIEEEEEENKLDLEIENSLIIKGEKIIIFIKYYCPIKNLLQYVDNIIVNIDDQISAIYPILRGLLGLKEDSKILLFEEVRAELITLIDPKFTFKQTEMQNGDIITFQLAHNDE